MWLILQDIIRLSLFHIKEVHWSFFSEYVSHQHLYVPLCFGNISRWNEDFFLNKHHDAMVADVIAEGIAQ